MPKAKIKVEFEIEIEFHDEISKELAIEEVTSNMYFPCEDTDNVSILMQVVAESREISEWSTN